MYACRALPVIAISCSRFTDYVHDVDDVKLEVGRVPGDYPVPAGYCATRHYPDPAGYYFKELYICTYISANNTDNIRTYKSADIEFQ